MKFTRYYLDACNLLVVQITRTQLKCLFSYLVADVNSGTAQITIADLTVWELPMAGLTMITRPSDHVGLAPNTAQHLDSTTNKITCSYYYKL